MEIIVNAAMSADGKLSTVERRQLRISGTDDFDRVDRLRASVDGVMVGVGTVLSDDPHLTVKNQERRAERVERGDPPHPARIVADSGARTPPDAAVLNDAATTHLLVAEPATDVRVEALKNAAAVVHRTGGSRVDLSAGISLLEAHGIDRLLVEGGGELIFSLVREGLVERISTFVGACIVGGADAPTLADGAGFTDPDAIVDLALADVQRLDDGIVLHWDVSR